MAKTPRLNPDLHAYLVSFVSHKQDVLALCLTSKEFLAIAEPELQYRTIRCKLDNDALWRHLASNPAQAARVRHLEICRSNVLIPKPLQSNPVEDPSCKRATDSNWESGSDSESFPPTPGQDNHAAKASEALLIQAVKRMVNLESFQWHHDPPLIHQGAQIDTTLSCYKDDVWTTLCDHTSLKDLKILDQPFKARPILDSTIFTLKGLTSVDLTFYHYPEIRLDPANPPWSEETLKSGRVRIEGFKTLTQNCPRLQCLRLTIVDRNFHFVFGGNPYTNITPIMRDAYWPDLTEVKFHDLVIDDAVMTDFLLKHRKIRTLSVFLSATDFKTSPFNLVTRGGLLKQSLLPNVETLSLPVEVMRQVLPALARPSLLKAIHSLEPQDWGRGGPGDVVQRTSSLGPAASFFGADDFQSFSPTAFDLPSTIKEIPAGPIKNILSPMPELRALSICNLYSAKYLEDLPDLTPNLEVLTCNQGNDFGGSVSFHYNNILPILARWKKLRKFTGISMWPFNQFVLVRNVNEPSVIAVARAIKQSCPLIEEITWWTGQTLRFRTKENGDVWFDKDQDIPDF
ncbi:hypothetical protein D9613_010829 [Agrocybe pediades]|uniref:Uncharacterized protein n=1 Tax=Agrocybe pediades TaxID=84607 RepID=A0A8H4QLJ9_9AGAR|nr:hypothetical protein D9613_010829 [Agrocybe pediades]